MIIERAIGAEPRAGRLFNRTAIPTTQPQATTTTNKNKKKNNSVLVDPYERPWFAETLTEAGMSSAGGVLWRHQPSFQQDLRTMSIKSATDIPKHMTNQINHDDCDNNDDDNDDENDDENDEASSSSSSSSSSSWKNKLIYSEHDRERIEHDPDATNTSSSSSSSSSSTSSSTSSTNNNDPPMIPREMEASSILVLASAMSTDKRPPARRKNRRQRTVEFAGDHRILVETKRPTRTTTAKSTATPFHRTNDNDIVRLRCEFVDRVEVVPFIPRVFSEHHRHGNNNNNNKELVVVSSNDPPQQQQQQQIWYTRGELQQMKYDFFHWRKNNNNNNNEFGNNDDSNNNNNETTTTTRQQHQQHHQHRSSLPAPTTRRLTSAGRSHNLRFLRHQRSLAAVYKEQERQRKMCHRIYGGKTIGRRRSLGRILDPERIRAVYSKAGKTGHKQEEAFVRGKAAARQRESYYRYNNHDCYNPGSSSTSSSTTTTSTTTNPPPGTTMTIHNNICKGVCDTMDCEKTQQQQEHHHQHPQQRAQQQQQQQQQHPPPPQDQHPAMIEEWSSMEATCSSVCLNVSTLVANSIDGFCFVLLTPFWKLLPRATEPLFLDIGEEMHVVAAAAAAVVCSKQASNQPSS